MKTRILLPLLALAALLAACRDDDVAFVPEVEFISEPEYTSVSGFYLLNEGNMYSNKASIDFYNYANAHYYRNAYVAQNRGVVMQLGDVGNDIAIYGNRLYAVINCSNKVEVMDRRTLKRIGQVDIPNCRYIKFAGGYAYVTSYAGPVSLDEKDVQQGYVARVDTATLQVVARCIVGRQPDGMEIVDDKIYVANSGGYTPNRYERTVSVVDIASFTEVERIDIAPNLQYIACDRRGVLWVTSRGDYYDKSSTITAYDLRRRRIMATLPCPVGSMWMDGDSIYAISNEYSLTDDGYRQSSYRIINTATMTVVNDHFITDGTDAIIEHPYGVAVNPITKDILITDAKNYIVPGRLYCFDRSGHLKWDVLTGDIPAHFVFLGDQE